MMDRACTDIVCVSLQTHVVQSVQRIIHYDASADKQNENFRAYVDVMHTQWRKGDGGRWRGKWKDGERKQQSKKGEVPLKNKCNSNTLVVIFIYLRCVAPAVIVMYARTFGFVKCRHRAHCIYSHQYMCTDGSDSHLIRQWYFLGGKYSKTKHWTGKLWVQTFNKIPLNYWRTLDYGAEQCTHSSNIAVNLMVSLSRVFVFCGKCSHKLDSGQIYFIVCPK